MSERAKTFKEVFPDVDTSLTPEQVQFAQGGEWKPDGRNKHSLYPYEDDPLYKQLIALAYECGEFE